MANVPETHVSPQHELALRFLERYSEFIRDLSLSGNFDILAEMPEFESFVRDTEEIFRDYQLR